jgi:hypothetical protein
MDNRTRTQEWQRLAKMDLSSAEYLLNMHPVPVEIISQERLLLGLEGIREMTTEEKLKAMEMLWDDICRSAPDFSSPYWHENVLKETCMNLPVHRVR